MGSGALQAVPAVANGVASSHVRERGSVLLVALLALLIIGTIGASMSVVSMTELEVAANFRQFWRAYYAADSAAQASFNELVNLSRSLGRFPTDAELLGIAPPTIDEMRVTERQGDRPVQRKR